MRKWMISAAMLLLAALLLTLPVRAAEFRMTTVDDLQLPSELVQAAPEAANVMDMDAAGDFGLFSGAEQLWREAKKDVRSYLTAGVRSVSALLAGVLLLGVADSAMGSRGRRTILMAGTLFITAVSAGDLQSLIGLGQETISRMTNLTTLLLPVLSAACAASGSMTAAALRQTATVWFSGMLLQVIEGRVGHGHHLRYSFDFLGAGARRVWRFRCTGFLVGSAGTNPAATSLSTALLRASITAPLGACISMARPRTSACCPGAARRRRRCGP